ncbi:MAG: 16S rRNA (uracil(1498)-N(3))-methyltransferase [Alphaproteobacteria bacterium]|nr:MAG: 16S rRNA (uracil(1498)-N(3))-methyltransferase [Alphaproteobacteria bacterium]
MRKYRLWFDGPLYEKGQVIALEGNEVIYLSSVLRAKPGMEIALFNEKSGEWRAVIKSVSRVCVCCELMERYSSRISVYHGLDVVIPLIRPQLVEDMVAMATQCGVQKIFIVRMDRSQNYTIRLDRLSKIIRESVEQCGRLRIPTVVTEANLRDAVLESPNSKVIVGAEKNPVGIGRNLTNHSYPLNQKSLLIVGPEGGFSQEEWAFFHETNAELVHVNTPIMRAETALPVLIGYILGRSTAH